MTTTTSNDPPALAPNPVFEDGQSEHLRPFLTHHTPIDIGAAGWFLLIVAIWELLLNRLASHLGIYSGVGAEGLLSGVAASGRLAMNAVGIMALVLTCVSLVRVASSQRFAPMPARVILMLTSPLYLPMICVAILRPVSDWLILLGYLVTAGSAALIAVLVAIKTPNRSKKRLVIALGLIQLLSAYELIARFAVLFHPAGTLQSLPQNAYFVAEILFVITPVVGCFVLSPIRLRDALKHPPILALLFALSATSVAVCAVLYADNETFVRLVAYRIIGIKIVLPGGAALYTITLFFGAYLIGSLILPSRKWQPTPHSKRIGFGLAAIFIAGIQPTHPYQFALLILGFLYLARGMLGDQLDEPPV